MPASPRPAEGALGPYIRAIRAHRLLVMVVMLVAIGASIAWITLRPPSYRATADVLVTPLAQDDPTLFGLPVPRESAGDPTRTVQTAASFIHSVAAAERTARELGGDWTTNKVLDAVTVTPAGESNILAVTAKADSAKGASRLANTFTSSALAVRRELLSKQATTAIDRLKASEADLGADTEAKANVTERINALQRVVTDGDPTLQLSQAAQVPESASGLPAPAIVILAALAGFTLGSGGALMLELTERRIRNEDEVVALYPLPVLARIPMLKPSQLRGRQASGWHMLPAVREAFRTLMIQLGPHPQGRAHVVMVTSASTGDGKTTSAVNLAAAAAASGDPVILLDFDLRKPDVGRTLGVQPGTELTGLLQPNTQLRDLLSPAPGLPALSVLTTSVAEGDVALVEALSRRLPELIADARELCNYVVIDTAPMGEISDALRLVADVDSIIVVTRPGTTNRANFEMMRDLLERTSYTPAGFLVIGDSTPRTSAYYAYGATGRELFLPAQEQPEAAEERDSPRVRVSPRSVAAVPDDRDSVARAPRERIRPATQGGGRGRPERVDSRSQERDDRAAKDSSRADEAKPESRSDREKGSTQAAPASNNGESDGPRVSSERGGSEAGPRRGGGSEGGGSNRRPARPPRSEDRPSRDRPSRSEDRPSKG